MFKNILLLLFIIMIHVGSNAQKFESTAPIVNLVFEGAGVRGIAYCGALKEMESRGVMDKIERVAGTSAGALMALAVSLGYSSEELADQISNTNFKDFNDGRFFFFGGINRVNKYFGWYRSNKLDKWLAELIEAKTGNANLTFRELHSRNYKDLYITGTCLNKQTLVVFSYERYPDMRVRDAVRISMSIPLYFEAVFMYPDGTIVQHPSGKENLDIMVDGGFTGNFPIHIFDSLKYQRQEGPGRVSYNQSTIGLRIDSDAQIRNDSSNKQLAELPIKNLKSYFGAFYTIVIENLNRQSLSQDDWMRTVSISDGGIGPRLRKLSKKDIDVLIQNGQAAMNNHFTRSSNNAEGINN
jgi:NTE family protein